jgi:hypothetical protein
MPEATQQILHPIEAAKHKLAARKLQSNVAQISPESPPLQPEILDLAYPLKELMEKMLPYIKEHRHQVAIGDDRSGRIPAIIITNTINLLYKNAGLPPLPLLLIEGERDPSMQEKVRRELEQKFPRVARQNPSHALFITDYISGGTTAMNMSQLLKERGIITDLATIAIDSDKRYADKWEEGTSGIVSGRIFTGHALGEPEIMGKHHLVGFKSDTDQRSYDLSESATTQTRLTFQNARAVTQYLFREFANHFPQQQSG